MTKIEEARNRQRSGNLLSCEITDLISKTRSQLQDRMNFNLTLKKDK